MRKNISILTLVLIIFSTSIVFASGNTNKKATSIKSNNVNTFNNKTLGVSIKMGESKNKLIELMGEPDRIDKDTKYYDWYIYNKDLKHYIQIGVFKNKVVAFATNSSYWDLNGDIKIGITQRDIVNKHRKEVYDSRKLYNSTSEWNSMYFKDNLLTFIWDKYQDYSLSTIILEEKHSTITRFDNEIIKAYELQAFDLLNVYRLRNGQNSLKWHDKLSKAALYHSNDMAENNFYSHISSNGDIFRDRINRFINDSGLAIGENIHMGDLNYLNALISMGALYNSGGHRNNILDSDYEFVGIGVVFKLEKNKGTMYITQNFIS